MLVDKLDEVLKLGVAFGRDLEIDEAMETKNNDATVLPSMLRYKSWL